MCALEEVEGAPIPFGVTAADGLYPPEIASSLFQPPVAPFATSPVSPPQAHRWPSGSQIRTPRCPRWSRHQSALCHSRLRRIEAKQAWPLQAATATVGIVCHNQPQRPTLLLAVLDIAKRHQSTQTFSLRIPLPCALYLERASWRLPAAKSNVPALGKGGGGNFGRGEFRGNISPLRSGKPPPAKFSRRETQNSP